MKIRKIINLFRKHDNEFYIIQDGNRFLYRSSSFYKEPTRDYKTATWWKNNPQARIILVEVKISNKIDYTGKIQ